MAYKHIWGFGGVKLVCGAHSATLSHAIGEIRFDPIQAVYETLNHTLYPINMGWRVHIEFEAVNTGCGDTYSTHQDVMAVLNEHLLGGSELTVYPRYSTTDDNLSYACNLASSVDYQTLAPVKAAQRIRLAFDSVSLVYSLPTLTSDQVPTGLCQLGGGGNNILLLGGTDKLLVKTGA
jgi:hypothetical protein